jgi:hypothetical protein
MLQKVLLVLSLLLVGALLLPATVVAGPPAETKCDDGRDNDKDGLVDCDDVTDCEFAPACGGGTPTGIYARWVHEMTEDPAGRPCVLAVDHGDSGVYACGVSQPVWIDLSGWLIDPPKGGVQALCPEFMHDHDLVPDGGYLLSWEGSCETQACEVDIAIKFLDPQEVCNHTLGDVILTATATVGPTGTVDPFVSDDLTIVPGHIDTVVRYPDRKRVVSRCHFDSPAELETRNAPF